VAKVWRRRTPTELAALLTFYGAVSRAGPPFRTPEIHDVLELDQGLVTVEARLPGTPLGGTGRDGWPELTDTAVGAVTDVLAGLAGVPLDPGMAALPVLEGEAPFEPSVRPFAASLADLVARRIERFRGPLSDRLPRLDALTDAVLERLGEPEARPSSLVHGDLIPANVHVDHAGTPVAVLDFGFLSTVGDPAFDAAVTASIYDMYGPRARDAETALDDAVADRFGHPAQLLAVYRAAYALVTSNCFSASGSDGHFAWCVRMLERADVLGALDL
jgi:aminoglycoside phosphotransferase (APT) family kinase protein